MRGTWSLALTAIAAVLPTGGAHACFYTAVTYVGDRPSEEQIRAQQRRYEAELLRARTIAAEKAWRSGVDAPAHLADLLVPNVRPVRIEHTDCGPMNEIDLAGDEATPRDLLAGTRYAARADDFRALLWNYYGSPGAACNAEVRAAFAAFLRRRLTREELRLAFIFLDARWAGGGKPVARLTAFAGRSRRPPLEWTGGGGMQTDQIRRWLALAPAGRALKQGMDAFWTEVTPMLGDTGRLCPAAGARWAAEQADLVQELEANGQR